jgi:hypothetical protein
MDAQRLWDHGTAIQRKYLEAKAIHGSGAKAAAALGVNKSTVNTSLQALEKKVAKIHSKPAFAKPVAQVRDGSKKIMVVFDTQSKPGVNFSYMARIGQYAVEKQPDTIVFIGDHADMPSLSSYDKGKKSFEGRRYRRDVDAAIEAMAAFHGPIVDYNAAHPDAQYTPRKVMTLGNHEFRIERAINEDAKLDGVLSLSDLKYEEFGFEVYPFLQVVVIEGVAFCHYFVSGVAGRPASTAAAQLRKTNMSCVAGHQQGKQIAYATRADGSTITSIICGSTYEHDEDYLGPQGNKHFRGLLMMHDVQDGKFDEMWVSLKFINERYPHIHVAPNYAEVPQPEGMR